MGTQWTARHHLRSRIRTKPLQCQGIQMLQHTAGIDRIVVKTPTNAETIFQSVCNDILELRRRTMRDSGFAPDIEVLVTIKMSHVFFTYLKNAGMLEYVSNPAATPPRDEICGARLYEMPGNGCAAIVRV